MVDGQHKLSRRALLGAVCASSVLSRHPELVSGSSPDAAKRAASWTLKQVQGDEVAEPCAVTNWDRALARFEEAQTSLDSARSEPDEDAYDALLDSQSEALTALLALPAPDLPALAAKLDVIVPQQAWELTGSEGCLGLLVPATCQLRAWHRSPPTASPRPRPDSVHAEARRRGEAVPRTAEGE